MDRSNSSNRNKTALPGTLLLATAMLFALGACGGSPSTVDDQDPASTTVPLTLAGSHVTIEALINGQPATLLLDTGADQNVLTPQAAQRLGLKLSETRVPGSGASGSYQRVPWVGVDELTVGALHQRKQVAFVVPMPREFTADGVLGTPFFAAFVTTIDYERRRLVLHAPGSFVPATSAAAVPVTIDAGKLTTMTTVAGVTGRYTIDTGAGNALTFFTPAVERYSLRSAFSPSIRTITGVSPGGHTYGDLVRVPDVAIGPYVLSGVVTELSLAEGGLFSSSRYIGNLGAQIWRRFTVTLDYGAGQMYLEPNAAYADSFAPPRSGVVVGFGAETLAVIDVVAGSPAAESGVMVGDRLVSLNGVAAYDLTPELVRDTLQQSPGTQVTLRLWQEQGGERDVVMTLRDLL
jgi:hypothetical protein